MERALSATPSSALSLHGTAKSSAAMARFIKSYRLVERALSARPSRLELPLRRQAPLLGLDPTVGTIDWPVDLELEQRLNWLSRDNGTTLFVVWLAALVALLAAETRQPDIIVGTYMTSRRRHPALRNMIGCFNHLVALRFRCDPAMPFSDWLFKVRS